MTARAPSGGPRRLRLALAQMTVRDGALDANLHAAEEALRLASTRGADLVAFPERFLVPARLRAEPVPGPLSRHFAALARRHRIHVVMGTIGERWRGRTFITSCLLDDRGRLVGRYRKRFLWWPERAYATPGRAAPVFRTRLGRIGLAVCWDLAFPEHFRDLALAGAEIAICPAFWQAGDRFGRLSPAAVPGVRRLVGAERFFIDACVAARAAENAMAVAFANACGRTRPRGRPDQLVGRSQLAVPFRGAVASAGAGPALLVADVDLDLVRDAERVYGLREDAARARRR